MTPASFIYTRNFPTLSDPEIQSGIDEALVVYYGVTQLWEILPEPIRTNKRTLIQNLIVAWWLANMFPGKVVGIMGDGGMPLSSKSVGGTSLTMRDIEGLDPIMKSLMSNTFGLQALSMIRTAPEMAGIYG
jgi:hypothetical protein